MNFKSRTMEQKRNRNKGINRKRKVLLYVESKSW